MRAASPPVRGCCPCHSCRRLAEIPLDTGRPVLLICNTQNRSSATLRALRQHGYGHVRYVHGGMSEGARRGWPVVAPQSP
ncbi:rhodanese-like domain-containing protein [Ottowia sp.]|uniref:rhodanese-like domain-containing protein n=1 Tax=Ottowia sp. TaxID=1898956 RepID=UPI0025E0B60D|nr:rhodanese-like domain-containing protein [Ottowia sp.]